MGLGRRDAGGVGRRARIVITAAFVGALVSGLLAHRVKWTVERGPEVSVERRLLLAFVGGFVAATAEVIDFIQHNARAQIFTAAIPPAAVAAVDAATYGYVSVKGKGGAYAGCR